MAFAQLTYRESLREIEVCLRSRQNELFHMGVRGRASRNTLAHANETRDWRIYADFAQVLINHARGLYADEDFAFSLGKIPETQRCHQVAHIVRFTRLYSDPPCSLF